MHKNKNWCYKNFTNILLFLIIGLGLSSVAFAQSVDIVEEDPAVVDTGFTPEIGDFIFPETDAYLGRTSTYVGPQIGLGNPETIKWKVTIAGPSALTADMVHLDEVGWEDQADSNIETFHYPFLVVGGDLVAVGSCDDPHPEHSNTCDALIGFSLVEDDVFTNADIINFDETAPEGLYTITYELVNTFDDTILGVYVVTVTLDSTPIAVSSAAPTILTENGGDVVEAFSPAFGINSVPDTDYYYGVHAVSSWTDAIQDVQWKITITHESEGLSPSDVEIQEVGRFGPGLFGNPGCSIETGEDPCEEGSDP